MCRSSFASSQDTSDSSAHSEWPFPGFVARTIAKFPDAGVCHVEEARVLEEEDGYTFLDVRTKTEHEYRIAGSVNVPIINAVWRFEKGKPAKVPDPQTVNADFVKQVEAKFPNKATKLIITCSDGRTRTLSALRALDAAGYTHLVGMKNGYNHWSRIFDNKFWRRVEPDAMREVDASDFPDQSTGIFGTGASYDRTDSVQWTPIRDPNVWLDWLEETSKASAS